MMLERTEALVRPFFPKLLRQPLKRLGGKIAMRVAPTSSRNHGALRFWQSRWEQEGHTLQNSWYEKIFLQMAQEDDAEFLGGKIVADFGCGPRGSLCWATPARLRIGIDILADAYTRFGIEAHDMCYVCSTEKRIPLPSAYVDVLFTLNAMDHVVHFKTMCSELLRILKPGGDLIASFNLHEPRSRAEPQMLTEERVHGSLLRHLDIKSARVAPMGPKEDRYRHFWDDDPAPPDDVGYLWVRATKKAQGDSQDP